MKRGLLYGAIGGALLVLLKLIEYQYIVRAYPGEVYGGLIALIFTGVGIYAGLRLTRPKIVQVEVVKEVLVSAQPFTLNAAKLKELAITQREHEILGQLARGLGNREIARALFISEATVKTHLGRIYGKLGVNSRVGAVIEAARSGLVTVGSSEGA